MTKRIISALLGKFGLQVLRVQKTKNRPIHGISKDLFQAFAKQISRDPLNPELHFQIASAAWEKECFFLANSELETAKFLGLEDGIAIELEGNLKGNTNDIQCLSHNLYYRLWSLATTIKRLRMASTNLFLTLAEVKVAWLIFYPNTVIAWPSLL